jgi:hypothetical protein
MGNLSPGLAALIGAALGVIGSIATSGMTGHLARQQRLEDQALTQRKERREALTRTYTKAIDAMKVYQQQKTALQIGLPPLDELARNIRESSTMIQLTGSDRAYKAFGAVIASTNEVANRHGTFAETDPALEEFISAARADIEDTSQ